jgi:PAS domain S-box-containing protein
MLPDSSLTTERSNARDRERRGLDCPNGNTMPLRNEHGDGLQASEAQFRSTFEQAAIGMAHVAPDGRLLHANKRLCDIVGYSRKELLQKTLHDITHPDDLSAECEYGRQLLANEREHYNSEKRYIRKDASVIWVNVTASLVRHQHGDPDYLIVVVEDIAERKKLDEGLRTFTRELESRMKEGTSRLESANKDLESFSYSVAHDLRAPLRGIDGWSLALLREYGSSFDERAKNYLQRVRSETQRMGELIDDMLMLSRVAQLEVKRTSFGLTDLAARVVARVRGLYPDRAFEFIVHPDMIANADPHLIDIVLTNLVDNACKFTRDCSPARIEIGQREQDGEPCWFVRDNGIGFDMKYAKKLFVPFQRLHRQSEFPGAGIGLAVVHQIVVRHGGKVWVDAQKHSGATFSFTA